jgi:hypothetical protein
MEGVSMYLTNGELQAFINALSERFSHVALLLDCYTPLAAKLSKRGNPVKDVGVQLVYGVGDPSLLNGGRVTFLQELDMSPKIFINETERIFFIRPSAFCCKNRLHIPYAERVLYSK